MSHVAWVGRGRRLWSTDRVTRYSKLVSVATTATTGTSGSSEARTRLGWIETWVPEGMILEAGSATGEFLTVASEAGYEAYGVEPSPWAAAVSRDRGAEVVVGTLGDWIEEFDGFTVDAVAMFHVLEHVDAPEAVLAQCRDALAAEGMVFIEVPNAGSRRARALDPSWPGWWFGWHHWHFTPASLDALLTRAGFEVVELHPMTGRIYTTGLAWQETRASDRGAGNVAANLDYLRVASRRSA